MKETLIVLAVLIFGLPLCALAGYLWLLFVAQDFNTDFLAIDGCLDGGGCSDDVVGLCRKHEVDAQALCDRGNPRRGASK